MTPEICKNIEQPTIPIPSDAGRWASSISDAHYVEKHIYEQNSVLRILASTVT